MNRFVRNLVIGFFVLLLVGGVVWFVSGREKPQDLQITFTSGVIGAPVKIYSVAADDDVDSSAFITPKNLVKEVGQNTTVSLKRGKYVVVSQTGTDYEVQKSTVTLGDKPEKVVINPGYTEQKLNAILNQEAGNTRQVITAALSPSISGFKILPGKMYEKGEWYATTIVPNLSAEELRLSYTDTYRVVLHKTNGSWKLATLPELTLSSLTYPDIPKHILADVNKQ